MDIKSSSTRVNLFTTGYLPGFISTLTFHQLTLTLFWHLGLIGVVPYSMDTTQPFGVPAVLSLAFWGGLWGILYRLTISLRPNIKIRWLILVAALLPTLVFVLVVAPIKSIPFSIFTMKLITVAVLINLSWALGTAFLSQNFANNRKEKLVQL